MGYMHIDNLYKNQDILLFKEVSKAIGRVTAKLIKERVRK